MSAMSDYLENSLIDQIFRGQTSPTTTTLYVSLFTAAPDDTGGGTELVGQGYDRVPVTSSLTAWAGTQSSGSTTASSGTGGATSNNVEITFPEPSASWGQVTAFGVHDASSGGNLLFHGSLSINKTINEGDTVTLPAGSLAVTFA